MAYYRFESEWVISTPIDKVYDALLNYKDYETWWPAIRRVRLLEDAGNEGVGTRVFYLMRSPLLYSLSFDITVVSAQRPSKIEVTATGDLAGSGTYLLSSSGANTSIRYLWNVATTKRWMNLIAPVARPLFIWAHHSVMRQGGAGLARHLGGRLVACHSGVATDPQTRSSTSDVLS